MNLELKTLSKQLLGSLPFDVTRPAFYLRAPNID